MKTKKNEFNRYTGLLVVMILVFSIIVYKIYSLQIINNQYYDAIVANNSTTSVPELAPRGTITDKNGVVLAGNKKSYTLQFTVTKDSLNSLYSSLTTVYKILDKAKEPQLDDFQLKVNPMRFEFQSSDTAVLQSMEIRFKRDRGMNSAIESKLFPKIKSADLSQTQKKQVNDELLKISPSDTFKYLIVRYGMSSLINNTTYTATEIKNMSSTEVLNLLLKNHTMDELRRFMVVKDEMFIQGITKPVTIASNISMDTAYIIQQRESEMPGINVAIQPLRFYPFGELGSAFLGYLSKINSSNQTNYQQKGYDVNTDYIGMTGIEAAFEDRLKGSKGENIVKLNQQGRIIEQLGSMDPYPGQNIQLSIDKNVQYAAEKALDASMQNLRDNPDNVDVNTLNATRGAAVAIDIKTGKILALVSKPGFNPNDFSQAGGLTTAQQKNYYSPDMTAFGLNYIQNSGLEAINNKSQEELLNELFPIDAKTGLRKDPYDIYPKPLFNYATSSLVPPGSAFKPMTAVAGLETGVITPNTTVVDNASFNDGNGFSTTFPSDGANGVVNLKKALEKSSNPFFMTVGKLLRDNYGDDILAEYAWKFGLGVKPNSNIKPSTGIEISESFGQVFNSWSIKNDFAQSYLSVTMDLLLSGKSYVGAYFKAIDLYYRDSDTVDVTSIKKQIKANIQQSIKTGKADIKSYTTLLTQLVNKDTTYKDKGITKTDISLAAQEIAYETVYDANYQTNIGTNMYNASIGQGIDAFTPLQLANYIATIVNGGTRYKLSLVDKITGPDGKVIKEFPPEIIDKTGIQASTVSAIEAGMHAVTGVDGTAAAAFQGFPIDTAGKTGSATFRQDQANYGRTAYAVYVGYAPFDDPQIAVCVLVFDGGHGGYIAPVARAMYEAYFKDQLISQNFTLPAEDSFLQDMFTVK